MSQVGSRVPTHFDSSNKNSRSTNTTRTLCEHQQNIARTPPEHCTTTAPPLRDHRVTIAGPLHDHHTTTTTRPLLLAQTQIKTKEGMRKERREERRGGRQHEGDDIRRRDNVNEHAKIQKGKKLRFQMGGSTRPNSVTISTCIAFRIAICTIQA